MTDPKTVAQKLVSDEGPSGAWKYVTCKANEAHRWQDVAASAHWAAVQECLSVIAPSSGARILDPYSSAQLLISDRGLQESWRHAVQKAGEANDDPRAQAYWLEVADAVTAISRTTV